MRAAVIAAPGQVESATVDDPIPDPEEVVVEVAAVGICGTDLHLAAGDIGHPLPVIPGHEFAGEVVAVGGAVTDLRVGDKVAVDPNLPCGACRNCRRGRRNLCERYAALGVTTAGAAAEYAAAPADNCVVLPVEVDLKLAALIEPLSCVVHAFDVLALRHGDHVLVYGAGTIGLMVSSLAQRGGAASVSVVDIRQDRLGGARELGADEIATSSEQLTSRERWDVVIDCSGAAAAIADGLTRLGDGGTFLQIGVASDQVTVPVSPFELYRRELTLVGSMAVLDSFERAAELLLAGAIDAEAFVTNRLPLSQYAQALEHLRDGVGRKTLILP